MSSNCAESDGAVAADSYVVPSELYEDIDHNSTWSFAMSRLANVLELPDVTTEDGLKEVQVRFDDIHKKLTATYNAGRRDRNETLMGAVVGTMAEMCNNESITGMLFERGPGILQQIAPLLNFDSTRQLALNALAIVIIQCSKGAQQEIARQLIRTLVRIIRDSPDNPTTVELAMVAMDYAAKAVIGNRDPPPSALLSDIDVYSVLEAAISVLRKPTISYALVIHAFNIITTAPLHCPNQCKLVPGLLTCIAAFTRSHNVNIRASAISGLLMLPLAECEPDVMYFDAERLMAVAAVGPPAHLREILRSYGPERSDMNVTLTAMAAYTEAIMRAMQDRDMYALGKTLADLIQRAEYVIGEGGWKTEDGQVFLPGNLGVDAPFKRQTDSLPMAARALRAKGGKEDLDAADVVEMKFFLIRQRLPEAIALARVAIKRNPKLAYAYYVISMGTGTEESLPALKKGLKCPTTTPFVRYQMLWQATSHAAERGLQTLRMARQEDAAARAEGMAFFMSAWADAKTFISEAPPDSRQMLNVLGWYIVLTLAIQGPELGEDLRELDLARRKAETSMGFMYFAGHPIMRTQLNLVRELIFGIYSASVQEWGALTRRFDELDGDERTGRHQQTQPSSPSNEDLAERLGNVSIGNEHTNRAHPGHVPGAPVPDRRVDTISYELYRCSWCGNPSAALRRCSACGKTRYCDLGCQKDHWAEHKSECKSSRNR
ncbi:hypothetical protein L226DRAFT_491582 [Lentinus tigrinus ALCF2SS1-7]|uniref:MYND-type domain-containing protein n=1 Tax=Lentinus tigrinus ALCF2SS1-6 TaxID=1328759 RepID=A0A5C2RZA8_9APHY|nr:hypothetical protein L227DRAFT_553644 [Lentinus tigrinus ALCF2SS1-6]RPD71445.1 hypothetical protein L226DRAFT_491582 [Lentinus tigrinus ALCF2SS1-7]